MKKYEKDMEYINIIKDILDNEDFMNVGKITHHKGKRLNHLLRVSYKSYRITKFLHLDYKSTARAGLLHDFFYEDTNVMKFFPRVKLLFTHPKQAYENSKKYFEINKLEKNIILSHMFPLGIRLPLHLESWIVNIVDDVSSINERVSIEFRRLFGKKSRD